jgi:Domain of Unknown Function with PDB structure (DUF3857)
VRLHLHFSPLLRAIACSCLLLSVIFPFSHAKQAPEKPAEKKPEKAALPEKSENPAQIELLETRYRFEANGDSRKEVHTRVHINNELGVRQFARLNFDYNRSFESIEIPLVHITHPSGGTVDILPSAITDQPNPAVINAPAYHDVRVKSVRILGLEPGDLLEYRIITTTTHHPLAPDFWLDHSFDRSGIVSHEIFELDLPASRKPDVRINPAAGAASIEKTDEGEASRVLYRWTRSAAESAGESQSSDKDARESNPDISISTEQWEMLSIRLDEKLTPGAKPLESISTYEEQMREQSRRYRVTPELTAKALELTKTAKTNREKLESIYEFVSQRIRTVDLPLGSTGFAARRAEEVLASGSAIPEDKFVLFAALAVGVKLNAQAALTGYCNQSGPPRPSVFKHLLISAYDGKKSFWVDPSLEVAPFGVMPPNSGKCVFILSREFYSLCSTGHEWGKLETEPPFPSIQRVSVNAVLVSDGTLKSRVHYSMRGESELPLRVAFHRSPKDKWKELAQLLSISDGFRGQVTTVTASDPYATKEPFTVDYEITQPKFVDWSKKPVHIAALLPQLGLPDPPAKPAPGAAPSPVELGTPLEVETHMALHLPPGTTVTPPTGTSIQRDYATFASRYSVKGAVVTASRHANFIRRQVPADRAADYNAFLHAVQTDQAQLFILDRESPPAPATKPAASPATPPPTPKP